LPKAKQGLKRLNGRGFKIIVISNQAGVSKGIYTREALDSIIFEIDNFLAFLSIFANFIFLRLELYSDFLEISFNLLVLRFLGEISSLSVMKLPIQYALTYPERVDSQVTRADFTKLRTLSFMKPETKRFPCLELAREALERGGTYPAALNAADEEAVRYFLEGKTPFSKIPKIIERVLARHKSHRGVMSVPRVFEVDRWARMEVRKLCQ